MIGCRERVRISRPISTRCCGLRISVTLASSTIAHVPSLPTSARATWNPFSAAARRGCSRTRVAGCRGNRSRIRPACRWTQRAQLRRESLHAGPPSSTMASMAEASVAPTVSRDPSYSRTVSSSTLSTVLPASERVRRRRSCCRSCRRACSGCGSPDRAEGEAMGLGGVAQRVQRRRRVGPARNAWPDRSPGSGCNVLAEVEDDRHVAALAREARAGAPREHRRSIRPADGDGGGDVLGVTRNDEPDWNLTVVRAVGRVQRPAPAVEANLAANLARQRTFELRRLRKLIRAAWRVRAEGQGNGHYPIGCSVGTS